eukprot:12910340-Prorocentrum_lima.AAC.1
MQRAGLGGATGPRICSALGAGRWAMRLRISWCCCACHRACAMSLLRLNVVPFTGRLLLFG